MKSRVVALAYGVGLVLATTAWAATTTTTRTSVDQSSDARARHHATLPISWVPDWLMEPLARAIEDATDPRDRKKSQPRTQPNA